MTTDTLPPTLRTTWSQPSLSRDFALLSAAIVFVMLFISAWVAWITYIKHSERIINELDKETSRIERTLETQVNNTGYLLTAIGRQIAYTDATDHVSMAHRLKSFSTGNPVYALWSWSDPAHNITVSSNRGVLDKPVNVGDRDYVQKSEIEPWVLHIGTPIEGRVSGRWIIPIGLGVTDGTGKYLGTLAASIDISALTEQISHIVKREGISFAIVSKTFVPLTMVADSQEFLISQLPLKTLETLDMSRESKGVMSQAGLFSRARIYSYYYVSDKYPYIIVVGYDNKYSDTAIRSLLWPRLIQIVVVAAFLLSFLWIIRVRVIKPVIELGTIAGDVAGGKRYNPLSKAGPLEIEHLSMQVGRIGDYIHERKLVEYELRNKIEGVQSQFQKLQDVMRQRSVMLAGLLSEYRQSLKTLNGHAQALKDQLYGPIENKQYRQYATDIHQAGTTLELMVRKLIALSRIDSNAVAIRPEKISVRNALEFARRFALETVGESSGLQNVQVPAAEDFWVHADGLHLQQALAYLLLCLASATPETGMPVECHVRSVPKAGTEEQLLLVIGMGDYKAITDQALQEALAGHAPYKSEDTLAAQLHFAMSKAMLELQQLGLHLINVREPGNWLAVSIPRTRLIQDDML